MPFVVSCCNGVIKELFKSFIRTFRTHRLHYNHCLPLTKLPVVCRSNDNICIDHLPAGLRSDLKDVVHQIIDHAGVLLTEGMDGCHCGVIDIILISTICNEKMP